ncbi:MAG: BACON domain-containing carbohydrate-binding protein [Bryobacteraceae bacterium]
MIGPALPLAARTMPALRGAEAARYLSEAGVHESLREAVAVARYGVHPDIDSRFVARNPAQRMRASFSSHGLELSGPSWRMTWRLRSAGYGARQTAAGPATLETQAGKGQVRVDLRRDTGIDEWYVNREDGLEHGFTLHRPPAEPRLGRRLRLIIDFEGDLGARADPDGQALQFSGPGGVALRYAGLKVTDAAGRRLASAMSAVAVEGQSGQVWLEVDDVEAVWPLTVDPTFAQQAYLKPSNTGAGDSFGTSVAVYGNTVAVGAWNEDSSATGINGANNDLAVDSGAVYVFVRNNGVWSQQAYLKAANAGAGDNFGFSVALSENTLVVGAIREDSDASGVNGADNDLALNAGAAYVFVRNGGVWSQQAYLKPSNNGVGDWFGYSVSVSAGTVVVGSPFEDSNATGVNGGMNESASNSGAAYVFVRSGATWSQQAYLKASNTGSTDQFGWSVGVSGDTAVVAAPTEDGGSTGVNGGDNNAAIDSGAAYVFVRNSGVWSQQAYLKASNTESDDRFGMAVAVWGDEVAVGAHFEDSNGVGISRETDNSAPNSGAAYVFVRENPGGWRQDAYLKASNAGANDLFGRSVAIVGRYVAVGAPGEGSSATGVNGADNELAAQAGAAYLFGDSGLDWAELAYVKPSNTGAGDGFGAAVAFWGDLLVAGAPSEDSNATGVNGNGADNSAADSGAAYVLTDGSCTYAFLPGPDQNFTAAGGSGQVRFNTTAECFAEPVAAVPWITIGETQLTGALVWTTSYSVAPNAAASIRSAAISVGSASITVTQGGTACSYGLGAPSANVPAAGSGQSVAVSTSAGCPWAAASNASWISIDLFQGSGFGSGSAGYTVAANSGAARMGTLTIAGIAFTVSQAGNAGIDVPPGVTPASGAGTSGLFTFTFSDPDGFADLNILNVLINDAIDGRNACYLAFVRATGQLLLVNDAGDAGSSFAGSITIPGSGSASNSQCTIGASGSSVSASGNTLALTLNIAFNAGFGGRKIMYQAARDIVENNTGWHARGVWTVPFAAPPTAVVSMTPARTAGSTVALTVTFSDVNGFADLNILNVLINDAIDGRNACYIAYVRPSRNVLLVNDAGDSGGPFVGSLAIPGAGVIGNSQCSINAAGSTAVESGNAVTLTLSLTLSGAFQGDRLIFAAARDVAENNSGWQAMGTITVP